MTDADSELAVAKEHPFDTRFLMGRPQMAAKSSSWTKGRQDGTGQWRTNEVLDNSAYWLEQAKTYFDKGWTTTPLRMGADGKAKIPITKGWQDTFHNWEVIASADWYGGAGIGIVLGPESGNLAVLDIDDNELAEEIHGLFKDRPHYWVRTVSGNGHLYIKERIASDPRNFRINWRGKEIIIELKARGQQVAAPPTPGYEQIGTGEVVETTNIHETWNAISTRLGIAIPETRREGGAGYPSAWKQLVKPGERNNAVYVESCRLKDAGMPVASAIDTMLARARLAFEGQMPESEVKRTVQSAYRKATGWGTVPV